MLNPDPVKLLIDLLPNEISEDEIKTESFENLEFDSMIYLQLLSLVEDIYEIEITESDFTEENFGSYQKLRSYIQKKVCL